MGDHKRQVCEPQCDRPYGCNLCNLFYCGVCHGFEGSLPTDCPGKPIAEDDQQLIYQSTLDFVDDKWVNKDEADTDVDTAVERLNGVANAPR